MFKLGYNLSEELYDSSGNTLYNAHQDLYAWYKFDQDISVSGRLTDSSGNSRSLIPKTSDDRPLAPTSDSPGTAPGFPQLATEFDNDLLVSQEGADIAFSNGFTLSTWVKFNTVSSVLHSLAYVGNSQFSGGDHSLNLYYQNTSIERIYARVGDADSSGFIGRVARLTGNPLASDVWYHFVMTYDGSTNAAGIVVYVNGEDVTTGALGYDNSSGTFLEMSSPADARHCIGNYYNESSSYDFDGLIAEQAIWTRSFTSEEVSSLYTLASSAYKLGVSRRVYAGSKTRGTTVIGLGAEGDVNNDYSIRDPYIRDGWNVESRKQQIGLSQYAKSNASDIILYDGKELGEKFDDTVSTTLGSKVVYFGNRRQTTKISHKIETRDLGYSQPSDNGENYFEYVNPDNPVEIINKHPFDLYLPITMVDYSSDLAVDGVIDPLDIRSKADRSNLETPFFIRGPRGAIAEETPFRRNALMHDGYNMNDSSTVPFLDAPEYFGNVELPPVFHEDNMKVTPFADTSNSGELYFAKKVIEGYTVSSDVVNVLISGSSFDTSDSKEFEISGRRGSDYLGGGTDSIAFGGLLK